MVSLHEIVKGVSRTKPLYLEDSYLKEYYCKVLRYVKDKGKRGYIVLDQSIFHPKFGGQPSDKGIIKGKEFTFTVKKVLLYSDVLVHWGKVEGIEPSLLEDVVCKIDWDLRYKVMKLHTAGHILDYCLFKVYGKTINTLSAFHGPPTPYLAYQASIPNNEVLKKIENLANEIIKKGINVVIKWVSKNELKQNIINAPNLGRLPENDKYRIVMIDGLNAMPCTGTHVKNTSEIGKIVISGVEEIVDGFKLFYNLG